MRLSFPSDKVLDCESFFLFPLDKNLFNSFFLVVLWSINWVVVSSRGAFRKKFLSALLHQTFFVAKILFNALHTNSWGVHYPFVPENLSFFPSSSLWEINFCCVLYIQLSCFINNTRESLRPYWLEISRTTGILRSNGMPLYPQRNVVRFMNDWRVFMGISSNLSGISRRMLESSLPMPECTFRFPDSACFMCSEYSEFI